LRGRTLSRVAQANSDDDPPNGRVRKVFDNYLRGYDIRPEPSEKSNSPRSISFELHGAFCGGHGTPSCFKEKRITAKPFEFKMPR
jgi:hypothetical protein